MAKLEIAILVSIEWLRNRKYFIWVIYTVVVVFLTSLSSQI